MHISSWQIWRHFTNSRLRGSTPSHFYLELLQHKICANLSRHSAKWSAQPFFLLLSALPLPLKLFVVWNTPQFNLIVDSIRQLCTSRIWSFSHFFRDYNERKWSKERRGSTKMSIYVTAKFWSYCNDLTSVPCVRVRHLACCVRYFRAHVLFSGGVLLVRSPLMFLQKKWTTGK